MAIHTTGELAIFLGTDEWRIRRIFECGAVPEPKRFGGKRAIPQSMIPVIVDELRSRGWLPQNDDPMSSRAEGLQ